MPSKKSTSPVQHRLSLVIPLYNEEESIVPLLARVHEALTEYPDPWEVILADDGSSDTTVKVAQAEAQSYGPHVRVLQLMRNFGQTAAMQAGIDAARGDIIVTMDGDLQNDPIDIPRLVQRLQDEDLDMITGWRKNRQDNLWLRKVPSFIANWLIGRITHVKMHDYGCSLKVYRASVIKGVRLYGEMHRFIPAWVAMRTSPARIKEDVVTHHARQYGVSKYGISRTFRVVLDLLAVYFFMRYRTRPGHFFGKIGLIIGGLGALALGHLFIVKVFLGQDIGSRPLLLIGVLFMVMSVQLFTTGVLSEFIARTYYETGNNRSYQILNQDEINSASEQDWKTSAKPPRKKTKPKISAG